MSKRATFANMCRILAAINCRNSGISVRTIAEQAGVSTNTVYRWLKCCPVESKKWNK